MAGRHRGMGGEHALTTHRLEVSLCCRVGAAFVSLCFQQGKGEQGGVALVEVVGDIPSIAQPAQDLNPTDSQHDLLT